MNTGPGRAGSGDRTELGLEEIALATGGRIQGAPSSVRFVGIGPLDRAGPDQLGLLSSRRYLDQLGDSTAGAILVGENLAGEVGSERTCVVVVDAAAALAVLIPRFHPPPERTPSVHPTAVLGPGVRLGDGVSIEAHAVVGSGTRIGDGSRIGCHTVVGNDCSIGNDSILHPHVVLYDGVRLGQRVIVHAGSKLGVDGFGYASGPSGHRKIPQVGECLVGDDVEIGAGACIDRGSITDTVIGEGTKIDNLVHIAHNVTIGPHSVIVAQVGISGSTVLGRGVVIGGQAGVAGHLEIGDGARIGGQSGVIGNLDPGAEVLGFPARPRRAYLRAVANTMGLDALRRRMRAIERALGVGDDPTGGAGS